MGCHPGKIENRVQNPAFWALLAVVRRKSGPAKAGPAGPAAMPLEKQPSPWNSSLAPGIAA